MTESLVRDFSEIDGICPDRGLTVPIMNGIVPPMKLTGRPEMRKPKAMSRELYSMEDMVRDFQSYRRQILAIMAAKEIRFRVVGKRTRIIDQRGYELVKAGIEEYRSRIILKRQSPASPATT